jgi:hypothetical protein
MPISRVFLIRHGEEDRTRPEDTGLSWFGEARAAALAAYFRYPKGPARGRLDRMIAAADKDDSCRPRLTLEPSAAAFGLIVETTFGDDDLAAVEAAVRISRLSGAHVLICWRHTRLLDLARALGATDAMLPDRWPDSMYDRMLLLLGNDATTCASDCIDLELMHGDTTSCHADLPGSANGGLWIRAIAPRSI